MSWEDFKKQKQQSSSWEEFKKKKENQIASNQTSNSSTNTVTRKTGDNLLKNLPYSNSTKTSKVVQRDTSLLDKATNLISNISNKISDGVNNTAKKITNTSLDFAESKRNDNQYEKYKAPTNNKEEQELVKKQAVKQTQNAEQKVARKNSIESYNQSKKEREAQALVTDEQLLENLSKMSGAQRVAEIYNITKNNDDFNRLNNQVIQYQTMKKSTEKANKINEDMSNGNYLSAIGHVAAGVPVKARDSLTTTMAAINSLADATGVVKAPTNSYIKSSGDDLLKTNKAVTSEYGQTTSQIDNGAVRTAANVSGTIGSMAPSIAASMILPGAGKVLQGVQVGADSYQENLNDDGSNRLRSVLTGAAKGYTSYALEGLTGGNVLSSGSLDDWAVKTIASKTSNKSLQKLASMVYEVGGEVLEEEVENNVDYVIDKIINNKELPDFQEWWNETSETAKQTILSTLALKVLGLGGNTYKDVQEYYQNAEMNKWISEAEQIIEKENLKIDSEKLQQKNNINELLSQLAQNEQNISTQQITPTIQNNAQNGISEQINNNYISEEFKSGLEKFKSGKYNDNDNIVVLNETPQWLYNKGFEYEQPIVLNMDKLSTIMKEPKGNVNGKNQHGITMDLIEQLPEAISNPLNVIKNPKYNNRYVVITSLTDQYGDIVIVPIEMNTKGYIEGIRTDVNRVSTVYGKENYDLSKSNEIDSYMEQNKNNIVYDIDTYNERSSNAGPRLQLTSSNIATSSINNIIPQNNQNMQVQQEKVKAPISGDVKAIKTLNPTEISNLKPSDASTTPKLPNINYEKGNKQSSFFGNVVTDAKFLNQDLRQELGKEDNIRYYKGITNQETLEKAYNSLNKDGEKATLNWISKDTKNINAEDVAKGWILLKQYQDNGDYQGAVEIAKKMRQMATEAGQTVQAYNILSRLTPEGMFYYAQSELTEAYNKMVEGKSQKWIEENRDKFELTPTETQFIMDNMKDVAKMEDGYDKKIKLAEIQSMLKNKIPPTTGQSIKAWMRISMLFNPKTQVRNVLGNAVVLPVNISGDIIASGVDKLISQKTGVRTTGNFNIKNYSKGFGQGLYESYNDFKKGINTREIEGNRFEISEGKSFKDKGIGKALNRVDNLLSFMLDAGDRGFYEATFTNSINNQLVLNNTTEVTQDMIDIATNEALQRTWQDNNAYTGAVLGLRNILNGKIDFAGIHTKGLSYGLGDIIIPFAKTPANLTKAIVDYSPIGLATTLAIDARKLKNSFENGQYTPELQHKFVQNLGKATAGSFLYVLGYALAKAGITSGEADDDKDVKNFMKNSLGISSYSIKIGDKTFTYDWAQPVATPFAFMANLEKKRKDNPNNDIMNAIGSVINTGTDILFKQSFMDSVNNVLNGNGTFAENLMQTVLELPARAVPTFSKQIADMVDGTQRTSFEYDKPLQSAINSVVAKIPVASKTLPVARDTLGNEIKKYGGENNLFNVMFNPANVNKGQLSKAGEEIYRLYKETGETGVFPITAPYYINSDGEKITMTAEERSNYQKVTGEYSEKAIEELVNNATYKSLSDEKKAEFIKDIISDSNAKAKYDILDIESDDAKNKRELIEKINTKNYYDYKMKTKDIEGEDATRKKNEVLLNSNYSNNVKETLYQNTTGKEDSLYNILSNGNIDINEYLDYKIRDSKDEFASDKDSDGKAISGSAKNKIYDYVNKNITGTGNKLIILGSKYKLTDNERKKLTEYINTTFSSKDEKIEIFKKLDKNYTVENGKVYYK